jgi:hypothetical protein
MKRLIGTILAVIAIASSTLAVAQHKTNSTFCYNNPEACGKAKPATINRVGAVMIPNGHLRNLLPADLVHLDRTKPTYPCNENGVKDFNAQGLCNAARSEGSGQQYVLRGNTAFIVHGGKPVKYAAFNSGTDSSGVAYLSDEARQFGEQHGWRHDPRSNTMVAINAAPPVAQAPDDCTGKVMLEKIACERNKNQTLRGTSTATASADPCAGKSSAEKQLCLLEQGVKAGVLKSR